MNRIFVGLGVAVAALSIAFAPAQAQTAQSGESEALAAVRKAIDQGNAQWSEGWLKGDAAMVAALFTDDGVQLTSRGKVIKGREQIREIQKTAMASADPGVKVTVTTTNVWLDGDTAYEVGRYKYEYTEKGKPGKDEGRYVTAWKRQADGSWKLTMDMALPPEEARQSVPVAVDCLVLRQSSPVAAKKNRRGRALKLAVNKSRRGEPP